MILRLAMRSMANINASLLLAMDLYIGILIGISIGMHIDRVIARISLASRARISLS